MPDRFDVAVIGAGMAGASCAAALVQSGLRVVVLEMEDQPGYHTTGRSAAIFSPSYGPGPIRALTTASDAFFRRPPDGFTDSDLISPRLIMLIARKDQRGALDALSTAVASASTLRIGRSEAHERNPLLREDYVHEALLDTAGQDIDVAALHQGYLRQFRAFGGEIKLRAEVLALQHDGDWRIETRSGEIRAARVINASGAWADHIGQLAGAETIGLTPKRRTAALIKAPISMADAPLTVDVEEQFYLKPEAGKLLISPADETPSVPCDAYPEDIDIAVCVDRIERAFSLQVQKIEAQWAGLRSFVTDKCPVVGYSRKVPDFFWFAGQGGYGIQSAPALSECAAAMFLDQDVPGHVRDANVNLPDLALDRLLA